MTTLALARPQRFPGGSLWNRGMGPVAHEIAGKVDQAFLELQTPYSLGGAITNTLHELSEVEMEASVPDWDGYGALPVDRMSLVHAQAFIFSLPSAFPPPEVAAHPDGEVGLGWEGYAGDVFSVSFSPDGTISYAGRFGGSTAYGSDSSVDGLPSSVLDGIRRLFS